MNSKNSGSQSNLKALKGDLRPTDYEYALLSQHVYGAGITKPVQDSIFQTEYRTWNIIINRKTASGYFGAVYRSDETKQFVIAHRGTNSLVDFLEDFRGVLLNKCSAQKQDAFLLVELIVNQIRVQRPDYSLSFTGHSLGAFLAALSVVYAVKVLGFHEVNAVTFESPGSRQSIDSVLKLCKKKQLQPLTEEEIRKLDIITYVCFPNMINSCNDHIGTVFAINKVDESRGFMSSLPGIRLLNSHGIDGIVKWFRMAIIENKQQCRQLHMADWPRGYHQLKSFCKYSKLQNGLLSIDSALIQQNAPPPRSPKGCRRMRKKSLEAEDAPTRSTRSSCKRFERWIYLQKRIIKLKIHGHFNVLDTIGSFNILPLRHFSQPLQEFLKQFYQELQLVYKNNSNVPQPQAVKKLLSDMWEDMGMPRYLIEALLSFEIRVNKDNDEEVACENINIYDFRQGLSCWLERMGFSVKELLKQSLIE